MILKCNHVGCGLVRRVSNSIDKIQVKQKIQADRLKQGYIEKEGQEREIYTLAAWANSADPIT